MRYLCGVETHEATDLQVWNPALGDEAADVAGGATEAVGKRVDGERLRR